MSPGTRRDDCTIFVTTAAPEGAQVRAMVAAWTASGIVEGSLWVTPEDFDTSQPGPPRVNAVELVGEEQRVVDLFTAIGTRSLKTVRVVLAQLVTGDGAVADEVPQAGVMLRRAISDAIPRREDDELRGTGTRLRLLNVIIPVSGASQASQNLLVPGWDANVVVSAEDRPDLDRMTVYVRHPGNFVSHAGVALCAVGGLLSGMTEGSLDHLELDSTVHDHDLAVARFTVRSVVGDDIVDDLAESTLDLKSFGDTGPAVMTPGVRVASDPLDIAQRAAGHVISSDLWQSTEHRPWGPRGVQTRQLWAAIRHAAAFNLRMFGVMARWLLSMLRLSVEQHATRVIVGEEGGIDVRIDAAPADTIADAAEDHLRNIAAEHQRVKDAPSQNLVHLNPAAWTLMRETATALADGAPIPGGFPEPRVSGRREIVPPSAVAPAQDEVWSGLDNRSVEALDVRGEAGYRELVAKLLTAEKAKRDTLVGKKAELTRALAADQAARDKLTKETDADLGDDADDDAKSAKTKRQRDRESKITRLDKAIAINLDKLQTVEVDLKAAKEEVAALKEEQERFEEWVARQGSFVRTIISTIVERRSQLEAEVAEASAEGAAPPRERLLKRQRVTRVFWSIFASIGLAVTALVIWVGLDNDDLYLDILIRVAWILGATLLILILIHHYFYRAVRAYEWAMAKQIAISQEAVERTVWRMAEQARLEAQEIAMMDWARILSLVVHRPWANIRRKPAQMPDEVVDGLPAAMSVAGVDHGEGLPHQSLAAAARAVYVDGWLGHAVEAIISDFDDIELEEGSGYNSVDGDTSDRESGPRRRFLSQLEDDRSRSSATDNALRRFTAAVENQEIPIPTRTVSRRGPYATYTNVLEPDYFAAIASESIAFASDVFSPSGRQRLAHYVARSVAWLPGIVTANERPVLDRVKRADGSNAVRMDLSKRLDYRDLHLFSSSPSDGRAQPGSDGAEEQPTGDNGVWN